MNTFNAVSFYVKVIKVRPGLKLNKLDKIIENAVIHPSKRTYHQMRQKTFRKVIMNFFIKCFELCQE